MLKHVVIALHHEPFDKHTPARFQTLSFAGGWMFVVISGSIASTKRLAGSSSPERTQLTNQGRR